MNYHGGVKFGDYLISKANGIYLLDVTEKAIPTPIIENGIITDYEDNVLLLSIGIRDYGTSRAAKVNQVLNAILNATKLQFVDETYYHQIVAVSSIDKPWQDPFLQLDVSVKCKPYKYIDEHKKALGATVINNGNYKAHTLLEVIGNATVNGMSISGAPSTVYINSEDKTAYTIVGGKKVNALQYVTGDNFLLLAPGTNQITVTGSVQISYKHTYLY